VECIKTATAVKHAPSSFNSQSARALVLFNHHHDRLWDFTLEALKSKVSEEQFPATQARINGFKNAHATILFFEDQDVVKAFQEKFPTYKDKFPEWSNQSSGMLQFIVWTALEQEGLGASLQHYNPLIDNKVKAEWNIPTTWKLIAQMPIGIPVSPAPTKQFSPIEHRVMIFE